MREILTLFWLPQVHVFVSDRLSHGDVFNVAWYWQELTACEESPLYRRMQDGVRAVLSGQSLAQAGVDRPASTLPASSAVPQIPADLTARAVTVSAQ